MHCIVLSILFVFTLFESGCSRPSVLPKETVLSETERSAEITEGKTNIKILYSGICDRKIRINGDTTNLNIIVREQSFGYPGQIGTPIWGIYDPGAGYYGNSDFRVVFMENEIHLSNDEDLRRWMYQGSSIYG